MEITNCTGCGTDECEQLVRHFTCCLCNGRDQCSKCLDRLYKEVKE